MSRLNPDLQFARDLIQFVMQFHRPSWKFSNELVVKNSDGGRGLFTENLSNYIQAFIEENDVNIQRDYEEAFSGVDITEDLFRSVGKRLNFEFFNRTSDFCEKRFIAYCGILAKYTVLSYIFGLTSAPVVAVYIVSDILKYLRGCKQLTDESWSRLHKYVDGELVKSLE